MLKRLELVGFKSFAERTQFEFSSGITAIVGPNGSGKSNIVDSVRWVLGEQSAKSLRGQEMADVIFNGSATRRSLGMAEVTMTFDNCRRALATDAEEVQISRRVYRSGEGEYLINGQVCRLKDIKQLFLGSGAGTDAYCIIEQGRVDVLLQASTRERRIIFEEAAGISRFKAKKIETLRKLERVDQNVQRLRDIIDEVEKQLRSVKLQASKAQRYQEYTERLKELRLALGLQEFRLVAQRLQAESNVLDGLRAELAQQSAQAEAWEKESARLEETLRQSEDAAREQEARLSAARQQMATEETTLGHEAALAADLEAELAAARERLAVLDGRLAALVEAAARVAGELQQAQTQVESQRAEVEKHEADLQATVHRHDELHAQAAAYKEAHLEQMRHVARLQNDAVSYKAHVDGLSKERERLRLRSEQAAETLASVDLELQELTEAEEALQARLAEARQGLADRRQERDRLRQAQEEMTRTVADLRAQRSGLASRIEVLEDLERSREGLGTGVREVLDLLAMPSGPWQTVAGMVADLLTVRREYAPLIDLALGDRAQRFIVRDAAQLDLALRSRAQPFSGRVSFLTLAGVPVASPSAHVNRLIEVSPLGRVRMPASPDGVPEHEGVVALAESLVHCDNPDLTDLPAQLLHETLIVRDLDAARAIAAHTSGYRFVTLQGEVLEPDGTLTVGTHHAEAGILSRKSELRELREQAAGLDRVVARTEQELAALRDRLADFNTEEESQQQEIDVLSEQLADLRSRTGHYRQRRQGLHEEVVLSQSEMSGLEGEIERLHAAWEQARTEAARAEEEVQLLVTRITAAEHEARACEAQRDRLHKLCTEARVALAQVEERRAGLRAKHQQVGGDLDQRRRERQQTEQQLAGTRARMVESQRTMLNASSALASLYLDKEAAELRLAELTRERDRHRTARQQVLEQAQAARAAWRERQEQAHARELQVNDLRHRRDTLVERIREDYQIDLAELYERFEPHHSAATVEEGQKVSEKGESSPAGAGEPVPAGLVERIAALTSLDPNQANDDIAELRRKLSRLGSVNLDALAELQELEARAQALGAQYDDLASAKRSLEQIIARINEDSRRLFTETFAAIRDNFQELFRKLFGGGQADIVLEDETDILECGIEIIARPPGKELRSISLMSGGEKTLTAVALLLAIFRTKPSPFCILDEVDAALDEANIGRYTAVLRDFLDRSHFILITHSKRTMACADVLYGITMQESGISKRVAVRFEDWPDDNEAPQAREAS